MGPIETHEVLGSTQTRAVDLARSGTPDFTVVAARFQSAGVGRLDHAWSSPVGGLYCSVVAPSPAAPPSLFPLAIGAELSTRLAARWGVDARLKWPNDLLVPGGRGRARKLAGILVDRVEGPAGPRLVAGVGVNVRSRAEDFPPELKPRVTTLAEILPSPPELDAVREEVVGAVRSSVELLASPEGTERLLERCRRLLFGVGRPALVDGRPVGIVRSVADDGALLLADGPAEVHIYAGDLTVLEAQ